MGTWKIDNGIITYNDGSTTVSPTANDFFSNKGKDSFMVGGLSCPDPTLALGISISKIGVAVKLSISKSETDITLSVLALKSGSNIPVAFNDGKLVDYIIVGSRLHFLSGNYESIASILDRLNIRSNALSLANYMELSRELIKEAIPFDDSVQESIQQIKNDEVHFVASGLNASLFPYQDSGCNWLNFMVDNKCGCILGDEMGLGKTLQIIALFGAQKEKNSDSHFLVICPVSLLENWKREIAKFYPSLSVNVHHGSRRTGDYRNLLEYDVNVMSYSNAQTDQGMLNMINWSIIVLDEAQYIKTPSANRTRSVKRLKKDVAIAVTGTPFENHMTDIWSIVDFVMPGYLGKLSAFETNFADDVDSAVVLEKFVSPIMIRRRVANVAKDLPPRIDIPQAIPMTEREASFYEAERTKSDDLSELKSMKLDKIQKLRMFCTHPIVYDATLGSVDPKSISHKYQRLCEILDNVFESGEKAIVFTSFNQMVDIICRDIASRFGVYTNFINGLIEPKTRQSIIDEFSSLDRPGILVLNPKAAGAGLNITAANHVIHYNLEWNPAIEDQASARAYRRGQIKTVFVHRLYYANTIEEIINEKIQNKRNLSETAIVGNVGNLDSHEDLIKALSISPINL